MSDAAHDDLLFDTARAEDLPSLMRWFPDERATRLWGGPQFRFPFTAGSFAEDIRWQELPSWCLRDAASGVLAFGQYYQRHGRINLARLAVNPRRRREGLGIRFIRRLMEQGRRDLDLAEFSLYVYPENDAALRCYEALGFRRRTAPADDLGRDGCHYMTCEASPASGRKHRHST